MIRTIDELYTLVTDAVLLAQRTLRREDYAALSELEEEIASIIPGDEREGQIARVGAITAARRSHDEVRFTALLERYRVEVPLSVRRELDTMNAEFQVRGMTNDA